MMTDLIARLEAAEEGPRELDAEIACWIGWTNMEAWALSKDYWVPPDSETVCTSALLPAYTTSMDAALALIPEGWLAWMEWTEAGARVKLAKGFGTDHVSIRANATTPALTLCAAALKARETIKENDDG